MYVLVYVWYVQVYMSENTYILVYTRTYTSEQCTYMFIPLNLNICHVHTYSEMYRHVYTFPEMY
jgi:hypothetical protein